MANEHYNAQCELNGTRLCQELNMAECRECPLGELKAYDRKRIAADVSAVLDMMPEGGMRRFFAGDACVHCVGEPREKASYGLCDIGRARPDGEERHRVWKALMGTSSRSGYMLPLQTGICERCRRNFRIIGTAPLLALGLISALGVALMSVRALREPLAAVAQILPFVLFLACLGVGTAAYFLLKRLLTKRLSRETRLNVFDIEGMDAFERAGWFELSKGKAPHTYEVSSLVFMKRPLKSGLGTRVEPPDVDVPER
ncbi:MAG: hypothetical protein Q4B99_00235 [Clostridia bacterium]|nr:hypothetical protein [Clostridia bacterium]